MRNYKKKVRSCEKSKHSGKDWPTQEKESIAEISGEFGQRTVFTGDFCVFIYIYLWIFSHISSWAASSALSSRGASSQLPYFRRRAVVRI